MEDDAVEPVKKTVKGDSAGNMSGEDLRREMNTWLERNTDLIHRLAVKIYRSLGQASGAGSQHGQSEEDLGQDLMLHMMEKPEKYAHALSNPRPESWIGAVYRNHLKDRERNLEDNPGALFRKKLRENLKPREGDKVAIHSFEWSAKKVACYRDKAPDHPPVHLAEDKLQSLELPLHLAALSGADWGRRVHQLEAALALWELLVGMEEERDFSIEKDAFMRWLFMKTHVAASYQNPALRMQSMDERPWEADVSATGQDVSMKEAFIKEAEAAMNEALDTKERMRRKAESLRALRALLSQEELQVLCGFVQGEAQGSLARTMGCSDAKISNIKKKAQEKLRSHFPDKETLKHVLSLLGEAGKEDPHDA